MFLVFCSDDSNSNGKVIKRRTIYEKLVGNGSVMENYVRCDRYVSNVSIIFDCSMLYYLLFWTLLGFIIHFYIIFGTNLLTGGPAKNCCFLPVLGFRRKGISNEVETKSNLQERDFINEQDLRDLDPTSRNKRGGHEVGGRAQGGGRAPHPRKHLPYLLTWGPSPSGGFPSKNNFSS